MRSRQPHAIESLVLDERRDLRRFLEGLTPDQWSLPTPCAGWDVRDVVAHLVGWDDLLLYRSRREQVRALLRFTARYATALGDVTRLNRAVHARTSGLTPDDLLRRFASDDGPELRWLFGGTNLTEFVVHHQDIRRAVGSPRKIPPERLAAALDGVTKLPGVRATARRELRHRRWEATDADWAAGRGPVVRGPGEELLMALAGRSAEPDEPLGGPRAAS